MCEHCGCREVPAVTELRDEHTALQEQAHRVREALARDDRPAAATLLSRMVGDLDRHVQREEAGIFAALREQGEFAVEVDALEQEHHDLDGSIAGLSAEAADFPARVRRLLDALDAHIEREDLGIFPVSVVTLGLAGWETVERSHAATPTFLVGTRG